jgi:hypothetical protein
MSETQRNRRPSRSARPASFRDRRYSVYTGEWEVGRIYQTRGNNPHVPLPLPARQRSKLGAPFASPLATKPCDLEGERDRRLIGGEGPYQREHPARGEVSYFADVA